MQRQEVDAVGTVATGREAPAELLHERGCVAVEHRRELDEPRQVLLAHSLALAELVGHALEPAGVDRGSAHRSSGRCRSALEAPRQPARSVALEQRRALEWEAGVVQELFEVGQPSVGAREDRHLLERARERRGARRRSPRLRPRG